MGLPKASLEVLSCDGGTSQPHQAHPSSKVTASAAATVIRDGPTNNSSAWAFLGIDARSRMGANNQRFLRQIVSPGDKQFPVQAIRRLNGLSLPFLT